MVPERPISPPDPEGLRQFVKKERWLVADGHLTEALRFPRRELFHRAVAQIQKIRDGFFNALTLCAANRAALERRIGGLAAQIRPLRRQGIESQREVAGMAHVNLRLQRKQEKCRWEDTDFNLHRTVQFLDMLQELEQERGGQILPIIDVEGFRNGFPPPNPQIRRIERRCEILRTRIRSITPRRPGTGDTWFDLLHPLTKTGQIILRFEEKVHLLTHGEVFSIAQRLKTIAKDIDIEGLLFDIAWSHIPFPFGVTSLRTPHTAIGSMSDLFPAVIADTNLDEKWAMMPFSILNGASWPFKSAVDALWEMMIHTNPFEIARAYWRVIEKVSQCMERMLMAQGRPAEDIEVDFDALFPLILICVFTFGVDEWMEVTTYTLSFMEHTKGDLQLGFAMTYLEGLVTQIIALDPIDLRRKAQTIRDRVERTQ
jgi:hypothetical protein